MKKILITIIASSVFFSRCYSPVSEIVPLDDMIRIKAENTAGSDTDPDSDGDISDGVGTGEDDSPEEEIMLEVKYEMGTITSYSNIYAIWAENQSVGFIQNISICNRLINTRGQTGYALPYWKINRYPSSDASELDAVTGATKGNQDFIVSAVLKDSEIRRFTVYAEVERSFDANDWFTDQPAILYSADIDLDSFVTEYELSPSGWTLSAKTAGIFSGTAAGVLVNEMRYITNLKDGSGFGETDTANRGTNMVKTITVRVTR